MTTYVRNSNQEKVSVPNCHLVLAWINSSQTKNIITQLRELPNKNMLISPKKFTVHGNKLANENAKFSKMINKFVVDFLSSSGKSFFFNRKGKQLLLMSETFNIFERYHIYKVSRKGAKSQRDIFTFPSHLLPHPMESRAHPTSSLWAKIQPDANNPLTLACICSIFLSLYPPIKELCR